MYSKELEELIESALADGVGSMNLGGGGSNPAGMLGAV